MLIANPLYDVVFKFLMEDARVARLLIGRIIGAKIEELTPRPQEFTIPRDAPGSHTVYRMDFSARIKTRGRLRTLIVEVQKAKFAADIIRFRRYLGQQYANPDNIEKRSGAKHPAESRIGIPIVSIYFLGYPIEALDAPVLKVHRVYTDVITKKTFDVRDEFIEGLTHDSYVIQATRLRGRRRNDLEALLAVFDQDNRTKDHPLPCSSAQGSVSGRHILNVREDDFPEAFRPLIRRLQAAAETSTVRETMYIEDEIFEELAEAERKADDLAKSLAEARAEKDQILANNAQALAEKDSALEKERRAREESERQLEALKLEIERLKRPIVEELAAPYDIPPAPSRRRKKTT